MLLWRFDVVSCRCSVELLSSSPQHDSVPSSGLLHGLSSSGNYTMNIYMNANARSASDWTCIAICSVAHTSLLVWFKPNPRVDGFFSLQGWSQTTRRYFHLNKNDVHLSLGLCGREHFVTSQPSAPWLPITSHTGGHTVRLRLTTGHGRAFIQPRSANLMIFATWDRFDDLVSLDTQRKKEYFLLVFSTRRQLCHRQRRPAWFCCCLILPAGATGSQRSLPLRQL